MAAIISGAVMRIVGFALIVAAKTSFYVIEISIVFPIITALIIIVINLAFTRKIGNNPIFRFANEISALRINGRRS
jgi:hypothetical protein